jgi:hypothetical protein
MLGLNATSLQLLFKFDNIFGIQGACQSRMEDKDIAIRFVPNGVASTGRGRRSILLGKE